MVVERIRNQATEVTLAGAAAPLQATKNPAFRGFFLKRLKGLEPSTFCMASGLADVSAGFNAAERLTGLIKSPASSGILEASWHGGNIAGWSTLSCPDERRRRIELRTPPAVPAAVESRHGGDGERRDHAAGADCRQRRGGPRWRASCSCPRSDSASTLATGCRSPSAAAWVLARRTRSGVCLRRFRRRGGGCGTRCRGAGAGTSTRWRSRRPASRS